MQRDGAVLNMVLRILLRVIAQTLQTHSPGAANVDRAALHIGAVASIHRFCSSLNEHVHFHVCVVDWVFEEVKLFHWTTLEQSLVADSFQPEAVIGWYRTNDRLLLRSMPALGTFETLMAFWLP
jgi:hypothetical protein